MNFYSDETYGEHVAGVYDEWYSDYDSHAIDALAELAHGARALELGIGTGRIALPLSRVCICASVGVTGSASRLHLKA